jgi:hypothetical protein
VKPFRPGDRAGEIDRKPQMRLEEGSSEVRMVCPPDNAMSWVS